jgi:hypothetical protein
VNPPGGIVDLLPPERAATVVGRGEERLLSASAHAKAAGPLPTSSGRSWNELAALVANSARLKVTLRSYRVIPQEPAIFTS